MATTLAVNPDANPETSSCDGEVGYSGSSDTFGNVRSGSGSNNGDSTGAMVAAMEADTVSNQYVNLSGLIILFDMASLPSNAFITSATLSITASAGPSSGFNQPFSAVELTTKTGGDTGVNGSDYDPGNRGSVELLSSPPNIGSFVTDTPEVISFTTAGVAFLNTVGSGIVRLACGGYGFTRNFAPTWSSAALDELICHTAESGTAAYRPILEVTYVHAEIVDETMNMAETIVAQLGITEIVNEALNLVETIVESAGVSEVINEVMNMVETIVESRLINEVVDEALNMAETIVSPLAVIVSKIIYSAIRGTRIFNSYIVSG